VDQEAQALSDAGHQVGRFERNSDDSKASTLTEKVTLATKSVWNTQTIEAVREEIARFKPDVVHVHNVFPMLSPSVLVGCRKEGVPAIVTFHNYAQVCSNGMLFRDGKPCFECVGHSPLPALKHRCYKRSLVATTPRTVGLLAQRRSWKTIPSGYVFLSESQKGLFSSLGLPSDRCFVKSNLAPAPRQQATHRHRVVYAGRLHEVKGVRALMQAWDAFLDGHHGNGGHHGTDLELVVIGSGPLEREIYAWAAVRPSVQALGLLSRAECAAVVSEARLAVVPSAWLEPFGLVVLEAMAAGVAVAAPAHGAFPELVTDGTDGVLYPPGDPEALANVFADVVRRPGWYDDLGRAGKQKFDNTYRVDQNIAQLEDIYRFAIEHPRA
jgi:glycosyltransferase involved in cell wall biosynthesis